MKSWEKKVKSINKYSTANGLRMALEQRLNKISKLSGSDIMRLRRQVAFDRFLARIFHTPISGFIAKGGYVLELRMQRARTTKDIDFSFIGNLNGAWHGKPEGLKQFLQDKVDVEMEDFISFIVGDASLDLENAPYGGFRFPIEAIMAGRRFCAFSIDIAAGDAWFEPHETVSTHNWFDFAGIPNVCIPVISMEQQFAEKLHSYTQPRDYQNSRVKDLVDIVLMINDNKMNAGRIQEISKVTFKKRDNSIYPPVFADPPKTWRRKYVELARTCGIDEEINHAVVLVREFCKEIGVIQ